MLSICEHIIRLDLTLTNTPSADVRLAARVRVSIFSSAKQFEHRTIFFGILFLAPRTRSANGKEVAQPTNPASRTLMCEFGISAVRRRYGEQRLSRSASRMG